MLTKEVVDNYTVIDNEPHNINAHIPVGKMRNGAPALISKKFVEADVRIVTGFIEPHFFAGFSGGPKGILPGVAYIDTIMANHRPENIAHPNATFGITEGNPLWEELRDVALKVGPTFLINVTLNEDRKITGIFAGDLIEAHKAGCEFVRKSAMQPVKELFDIVITTNSGYPLDLNLYQGIKGLSAAAKIVKQGGTIILACQCRDGVPYGSSYEEFLRSAKNPQELITMISGSDTVKPDQWQVQIQAQIQMKAQVYLYSSLPEDVVKSAHFIPCRNIEETINAIMKEQGEQLKIAVLPYGPLTIPYLATS